MQWALTAIALLRLILHRRDRLHRSELDLLLQLFDLIKDILANNPVYCFDDEHECTYHDKSNCYIMKTKGENWTVEDVRNCPYRKKV